MSSLIDRGGNDPLSFYSEKPLCFAEEGLLAGSLYFDPRREKNPKNPPFGPWNRASLGPRNGPPQSSPRSTPRDSRARGRKYHKLLYYLRGGGNAHWGLAWLYAGFNLECVLPRRGGGATPPRPSRPRGLANHPPTRRRRGE
eukprot:scaffold7602_cov123-Isochrysis_galbana.AAC.1